MLVRSKGMQEMATALEEGKRVVWQREFEWLFCFTADFDARLGNYVTQWIPPGYFELLYPLSSRECIIGIKFCVVPAQLEEDYWLLAQLQEDGNLSAMAILQSCENMARIRGQTIQPKGLRAAKAFLDSNIIPVPSEVWQRALPDTNI